MPPRTIYNPALQQMMARVVHGPSRIIAPCLYASEAGRRAQNALHSVRGNRRTLRDRGGRGTF